MTQPGRFLVPGEYWFDDLQLGDWFETGKIVVTEAHIVGFAGLSGDFFDVHMDDVFAREQGFPARLAHGLLGLALTDGLKNRAAARLMASASLGWSWSFRSPICAGDRIGATITVAELKLSRTQKPVATLAITVTNQHAIVVQDGSTTLLLRQRPEGAH